MGEKKPQYLIDMENDLKELKANIKKVKEAYKEKSKPINKYVEKYLGDYRHTVDVLPLKYARNNVLEISVTADKYGKKDFTKKEVQGIVDKLSNKLSTKGVEGLMTVSLEFDRFWRNGRNSEIGNDISLYNPTEYDNDVHVKDQTKGFDNFRIYLMPTNKIDKPRIRKNIKQPKGGADIFNRNDCLYYCLKNILHDKCPFTNPASLKRYLKLKLNDKVPLNKLPDLESKLKMGINVSGDFELISQYKSKKQLHLKLVNQHYSVNYDANRKTNIYVSYSEKEILLRDKTNKTMHNGTEYIDITNDLSYKYMIIDRSNHDIPMEEEYNQLKEGGIKLKEATNGDINIFKTGSFKNTSLYLFESLTRYIPTPDEITYEEKEWIEKCTTGALIFAEEYEGPAYKYDVKSRYPSIMCSSYLVPIKQGKFENWTTEMFNEYEEWFPTGIYRCKIFMSGNKNTDRLFRFNQNNYYSSNALKHAKFLKLEIELVIDGDFNALLYPKELCMCSSEIFKDFVDYLYPLKEKSIPYAKVLLNRLWGALVESNDRRIIIDKTNPKLIEYEKRDISIVNIKPSRNKNQVIVDICDNDNFYKSGFARMKPFLLDKAKYWMTTLVYDYKDNIKRFHTDGFITDIKLDVKTGDKLGDLCYEGYYNHCIIQSCASPIGEFIKNKPANT
jgi:hypothetical protein